MSEVDATVLCTMFAFAVVAGLVAFVIHALD